MPSLKSSEVRCSNLSRFAARGGGESEEECDRLNIVLWVPNVVNVGESIQQRLLERIGSRIKGLVATTAPQDRIPPTTNRSKFDEPESPTKLFT